MTTRQLDPGDRALDGRAKLTEQNVREIRRRYASGETCEALAAVYHVGYTAVQKIIRRATWKHVRDGVQIDDPSRRWSEAEIEYLQRHADDAIVDQARALRRSESAVMVQRSRLGFGKQRLEPDDASDGSA